MWQAGPSARSQAGLTRCLDVCGGGCLATCLVSMRHPAAHTGLPLHPVPLRPTPSPPPPTPCHAAYIKSVLCPSLTPRPGADTSGPSTPTSARPPAEGFPAGPLTATQRYYHRARSSFGSMQLDAEYMRELDRVRAGRVERAGLAAGGVEAVGGQELAWQAGKGWRKELGATVRAACCWPGCAASSNAGSCHACAWNGGLDSCATPGHALIPALLPETPPPPPWPPRS